MQRRQFISPMVLAAALISLCLPICLLANGQQSDADLTAWARQNLHTVVVSSPGLADRGDAFADLEPLRHIIADATVVSFGEGLHGSAEPLEFRNRLFRFLVEEMGFTAIALESGITESYIANQYVLGGPGDAQTVAASGITSGLGGFPQQAELLQWMRAYNADPAHTRKIEFYGMDISAAPGEPGSAFELALDYLVQVDPAAAKALHDRIRPVQSRLRINRRQDDKTHYAYVSMPERDAVTGAIADLVVQFETNEIAYITATTKRRYALAYRAAIAARQSDNYLRQYPVGWTPEQGTAAAFASLAVADRAKMENAEWIVEQQGRDGKLLIFAHLGHVATTPVYITIPPQPAQQLPPMLGEYLKPRYGSQLVTMGHLLGQDSSVCEEQRAPAPPGSTEALLAATGAPEFVLDLRSAPAGIHRLLMPLHDLYGQRPIHSLSIGAGVDVVVFSERATRAVACE